MNQSVAIASADFIIVIFTIYKYLMCYFFSLYENLHTYANLSYDHFPTFVNDLISGILNILN